ncbi:unnamed protein product [Peniophora sp. CBMAI 1063]|nr:unnamed protein product [Peniophora sp. CBMAI 1063]
MPEAFHHRPTLKQTNKAYKSRHASKSSLKELSKGRAATPRQSPKNISAARAAAQSKLDRKNHARQAQAAKRSALVSATRVFAGVDGAPRIVAVIPLAPDVDARDVSRGLAGAVGAEDEGSDGLWKIRADRFKTSLQFIQVPYGQFYAALDAAKAADYVVLALSPETEVDEWGDTLLRTLQAQGLPTPCAVIPPSFSTSSDPKARAGVLKSLLSFTQYFAPDVARVYDLSVAADALGALRVLAEGKPKDVRWREGRVWVLGEDVRWDEGEAELKVTGTVRGAGLSANRLVHIPNFGDFQIAKIESAPLPRTARKGTEAMDVEPTTVAQPDEDADSLVSSNDPDDMANEQTWPTEEEMAGANPSENGHSDVMPDANNGTTPKTVRKIPKGMSEYQAAWILDDDEEDGEGSEGEDGDKSEAMDDDEEEMVDAPIEDDDLESRRSVMFQDLDEDEEERQLANWKNRDREEQDDAEFPDEIDTPRDIPARQRFARYRGLRSMRTSPWDPYESLPRDYARIFQFEDYKRTERSVRRREEADAGAVQPGTRVTITLKDAPREAAEVPKGSPFVLFGLHQHEHKKTVVNFTVLRNTEYDGSVRSKDELVLCVGPRRLRVKPIYSQHTRGGGKGPNNVHKFERYLRHGTTTVASVYAPILYGNQPIALLRESDDPQAPNLVAMGTFKDADPTRVIAKRILLSGHPFKVHRKTATVRYMFFNADDVLYYKPVQLHTKMGRSGHIKESLGTHGYFKAHFDGPVSQMDTVLMALYKRVFPRWSETFKVNGGGKVEEVREDDMMQD